MDFGPLEFKIEKPPKRLPLWPDPIATYNLGGDYWSTIQASDLGATFDGRTFEIVVPAGYLVNVAALPATLRWFVRPHSQCGFALLIYQYLRDHEFVYDTDGKPLRLTRHQISRMVTTVLYPLVPKWRWRAILAQLVFSSRDVYLTPNYNPNKVVVEIHNAEKLRKKKEARSNDRA